MSVLSLLIFSYKFGANETAIHTTLHIVGTTWTLRELFAGFSCHKAGKATRFVAADRRDSRSSRKIPQCLMSKCTRYVVWVSDGASRGQHWVTFISTGDAVRLDVRVSSSLLNLRHYSCSNVLIGKVSSVRSVWKVFYFMLMCRHSTVGCWGGRVLCLDCSPFFPELLQKISHGLLKNPYRSRSIKYQWRSKSFFHGVWRRSDARIRVQSHFDERLGVKKTSSTFPRKLIQAARLCADCGSGADGGPVSVRWESGGSRWRVNASPGCDWPAAAARGRTSLRSKRLSTSVSLGGRNGAAPDESPRPLSPFLFHRTPQDFICDLWKDTWTFFSSHRWTNVMEPTEWVKVTGDSWTRVGHRALLSPGSNAGDSFIKCPGICSFLVISRLPSSSLRCLTLKEFSSRSTRTVFQTFLSLFAFVQTV